MMSWKLKLQHALNHQSILTALVCLEEIVGFPVQKKIILMANVASLLANAFAISLVMHELKHISLDHSNNHDACDGFPYVELKTVV